MKEEKGSFRDPAGKIFYHENKVFRKLSDYGFKRFEYLYKNEIIQNSINANYLIHSRLISDDEKEEINLNIEDKQLSNIDAYPNPATNVVSIPLNGYNGKGTIKILDVTGKLIATKSVNANNLISVDVTDISNGNYLFDLNLEDGRSAKLNIVISK